VGRKMAKKKSEKLWPKSLFCVQQDDGDGPYIVADYSPQEIAQPDKDVPVAVYEFIGIFTVRAPVEIAGAVVSEIQQGPKGFSVPKRGKCRD
jgi:hypothetical protein